MKNNEEGETEQNTENADNAGKISTVIEKMAKAMGNVFRKKTSAASHTDEKTPNEAKDECISLRKIQILGNLDRIIEKRRAQMEKEIESMQSEHEMERREKNEKITTPNKHVTITENKCQLYETNDEPTLDEEIEQEELLLLREEI
uniref:Pinin/SDK/MemA protein domain-containing protein n=1 Tax=Ascaris lumbricoides TaxID=6252 RepID=A0A0M3IDD4_ASCLU